MIPPAPRLRVWPAVAIVLLMWTAIVVFPRVAPETMLHFLGTMLAIFGGTLLLLVWWVFFSRATARARWGGGVLFVVAFVATAFAMHPSMQASLIMHVLPRVALLVVAVALLANLVPALRRPAVGIAALVVAFVPWLVLQNANFDGEMRPDYHWRWGQVGTVTEPEVGTVEGAREPLVARAGDWTGFRGPHRDARVSGVRVDADWEANPPLEVWRRPVGRGWSSMAVVDGHLFTQELRGDDEIVAAYRAADGQPVWSAVVGGAFSDPMSGAGPRATPAFADGRVYAVGAYGVLSAHDAATGTVLWTHDLRDEHDAPLPPWAFSNSPEIVGDLVVVYAGNPEGAGLVAYDRVTGDRRWTAPAGRDSYSAPHLVMMDGVPQVLMLHGGGLTSVDPASGEVLWEHAWALPAGQARMVQPLVLDGGGVLLATSFGEGTRRIRVTKDDDGTWATEEVWTSTGMKPYYNDFVAHDGHLYGFDTKIFASISLDDGARNWKRGRYGHGQVLLLEDAGQLLVLSETGDLVLVDARSDSFVEHGRIEVLAGTTWNHPALVGDVIYVRNDREMAAYRLPTMP